MRRNRQSQVRGLLRVHERFYQSEVRGGRLVRVVKCAGRNPREEMGVEKSVRGKCEGSHRRWTRAKIGDASACSRIVAGSESIFRIDFQNHPQNKSMPLFI